MRTKSTFLQISSLFTLMLVYSCSPRQHEAAIPTASGPQISRSSGAPEWDKLLHRNKGWFGGDGI
ncbi:MAG: hypothetical protein ACKOZV_11250, partial [Bacteroidota bacterium]